MASDQVPHGLPKCYFIAPFSLLKDCGNSEDPDKMPQNVASYQSLHFFLGSDIQGQKCKVIFENLTNDTDPFKRDHLYHSGWMICLIIEIWLNA